MAGTCLVAKALWQPSENIKQNKNNKTQNNSMTVQYKFATPVVIKQGGSK